MFENKQNSQKQPRPDRVKWVRKTVAPFWWTLLRFYRMMSNFFLHNLHHHQHPPPHPSSGSKWPKHRLEGGGGEGGIACTPIEELRIWIEIVVTQLIRIYSKQNSSGSLILACILFVPNFMSIALLVAEKSILTFSKKIDKNRKFKKIQLWDKNVTYLWFSYLRTQTSRAYGCLFK